MKKNTNKHLFICTTPLQFLTIVNLKLNNLINEDVTLYILNHTPAYKE